MSPQGHFLFTVTQINEILNADIKVSIIHTVCVSLTAFRTDEVFCTSTFCQQINTGPIIICITSCAFPIYIRMKFAFIPHFIFHYWINNTYTSLLIQCTYSLAKIRKSYVIQPRYIKFRTTRFNVFNLTLNRRQDTFTDSNLNHTGIYLYSKGKIMIHLTFDYQSDEGCTTPGQYLRYHRTFQGLTTRELAEKVGVVPATLVLYENDRHPIKHSTAVALANVLGIDRSRLLDEYTVFVDYPYSSLLKKVRRELSFTQMQMAEVIGIGQTTYSGWEREVRVPRRKEHEKILAAMKKLKVDVDTYLCQPNPL